MQNETNVTDLRNDTVSTESGDVDVDDYDDCLKNNVVETPPKNRENITIENEVIENSTAGNNDRGCSDLEVEVGDEVTTSREHENENKPDAVSFCLKKQNIPTEVGVERTTTNSGCEKGLTVNNAVKNIEPALEMDTGGVPILECERNNESTSTSICTKNKDEKMQLDEEKHNKNEDALVPSLPCATDEQQDEENKIQETLIAQQISEGFLTDSMLDQEKILHKQHLEEEKESVNQVSISSLVQTSPQYIFLKCRAHLAKSPAVVPATRYLMAYNSVNAFYVFIKLRKHGFNFSQSRVHIFKMVFFNGLYFE